MFAKILVCSDGSAKAIEAATVAAQIACRFGSDIVLLSVYDPSGPEVTRVIALVSTFLAVTDAPGAGAALVVTYPRIVAVVSCAIAGVAASRDVARSAARKPMFAFPRRFEPIMSYSPSRKSDWLRHDVAVRCERSTRAR